MNDHVAETRLSERTVLIALCGLSPAVLTETVWALAHETPATVPDRVVAVTTTTGRMAIRHDLLDSGVWQRLRDTIGASAGTLAFGNTGDAIRVFPAANHSSELADIAELADNVIAADFILETLRQFTESPDTRVVFSIAGGRKTMTALAALAMTLLGRQHDRLCHVLVPAPFDSPALSPRFFFPNAEAREYRAADGTSHSADRARITLCDIPFVRVRYLLADENHRLPGAFMRTVEQANAKIAGSTCPPVLRLCPKTMACSIDDLPVKLSAAEFAMCWLMAERRRKGNDLYVGPDALFEDFNQFAEGITTGQMPELLHSGRFDSWRTDAREVSRLASKLKRSIQRAVGSSPRYAVCIPNPVRARYGFGKGNLQIEVVDA